MTDERQNEIWAMLPNCFKQEVIGYYDYLEDNAMYVREGAQRLTLETLFGKHNLTAQAEEKPKEPRFKRGDKVVYYGQLAVVFNAHEHGYDVVFQGDHKLFNLPESHLTPYHSENSENDENSVSPYLKRTNPTENGISDSKIQSESAESVETSANSQVGVHISSSGEMTIRQDIYQQYRLDLAKEIALRLIGNCTILSKATIAYDCVSLANDIVKRLKETEI